MEGTPKFFTLSEQFRGRIFEITKDEMSIGRVDQRDICIKDPTVSTDHCTIIRRNGSFFVRDNGSTNGTRINGNPLEPGVEQELVNTDVLLVGGIELLFDNDDKSVTTVMRTTAGIDLDAGKDTQTIERIDVSQFTRKHNPETSHTIFNIVIALIALAVLGVAAYFVYMVMQQQ